MADAAENLRGIVRGKHIELDRDAGLPDGEVVTVKLQIVRKPGEGIRRSAGAWGGEEAALEQALEEMRRSRHAERGSSER